MPPNKIQLKIFGYKQRIFWENSPIAVIFLPSSRGYFFFWILKYLDFRNFICMDSVHKSFRIAISLARLTLCLNLSRLKPHHLQYRNAAAVSSYKIYSFWLCTFIHFELSLKCWSRSPTWALLCLKLSLTAWTRSYSSSNILPDISWVLIWCHSPSIRFSSGLSGGRKNKYKPSDWLSLSLAVTWGLLLIE